MGEEKTKGGRYETIRELIKEQKEAIVNREAALRTLGKMDPEEVWEGTIDKNTFQPKEIKVKDKVQQAKRALRIDKLRLEALQEMLDNQ